jgi:hypothetical protein
MSKITETLASEVVASFRAELGEALIAEIGEGQLRRLELLVAEAVGAGILHASDQVDSLGRSLRRESGEASGGIEL